MKTIKFMIAFTMAVVLTTGIFSIVKTSYNSGKIDSSLILQNIEALSQQGEEGYNSTDCANGPAWYGKVESFTGKCEIVEHLSDGLYGRNGVDRAYTVDYKGCSATGTGGLSGVNYCWPTESGPEEIRECAGERGHRSFPF